MTKYWKSENIENTANKVARLLNSANTVEHQRKRSTIPINSESGLTRRLDSNDLIKGNQT